MLRLGAPLMRILGPAALCALALAACGSQQSSTSSRPTATTPAKHDTHTVYIYSSLPFTGAQAADSVQITLGINLALTRVHHQAGAYRVRYRSLKDSYPSRKGSSRRRSGWSQDRTVRNAQTAASNPQTVAYIGDLNSGATELSLPILNQAGIVQITPGSGYPGLTDKVGANITAAGEPDRYYPQSKRTLLRMIPNDLVQAAAALYWLHQNKCEHVQAASFGPGTAPPAPGPALVRAIEATARLYGMTYVQHLPAPGTDTRKYSEYAAQLNSAGVQCFVLTGSVTPAAVALTDALHAQLPVGSMIVGTGGFCSSRWTDHALGGVPSAVDAALYCTSPVRDLRTYAGASRFAGVYQRRYGHRPTAYAYYGYEAARLVLTAMREMSGRRDSREQVLDNLINGVAPDIFGTEGFDADGNLLSRLYGLYNVVAGHPHYDHTLNPPFVSPSEA